MTVVAHACGSRCSQKRSTSQPASARRLSVSSVPLDVPADLVFPVRPVRLGHHEVFRAAVPEAAIDENGHLHRAEDHVGRAAHLRERLCSHPVAQTSGVDKRAEEQLGCGIAIPVAEHASAVRGRCRPRPLRRCPLRGRCFWLSLLAHISGSLGTDSSGSVRPGEDLFLSVQPYSRCFLWWYRQPQVSHSPTRLSPARATQALQRSSHGVVHADAVDDIWEPTRSRSPLHTARDQLGSPI